MVSKRSQQKEATRLKLIEAGARVFAAKGVEGARIGDIAREAGVAMGTLYTHFPDKDALFTEVMRAGKDLVLAGLEEGVDPRAAARGSPGRATGEGRGVQGAWRPSCRAQPSQTVGQ